MAKTSKYYSALRKKKFKVREYSRCPICGRARSYMRRFDMCRLCFRRLANEGMIPGVKKASW